MEHIVDIKVISDIERDMVKFLDNKQLEALHTVLCAHLNLHDKDLNLKKIDEADSASLLDKFLEAKRVEGCSLRTLEFYAATLKKIFRSIDKDLREITTEDLRAYLDSYSASHNVSKITIDNMRRILSSFFNWLEEESYIIKSPVKRIHKVKTAKMVKTTFSDEILEKMRDACTTLRDLVIVDLLSSSGIRVGELVKLNIDSIDLNTREFIVFGKGSKERKAYFDARTKLHLEKYLESRIDNNPALFVSLTNPVKRLQISGVEIMLRKLGQSLNIPKVHPHKFRRTLATIAISKGMPIEQVQHLLGHQNLDTTMQYAMVNENNVKQSHQRLF